MITEQKQDKNEKGRNACTELGFRLIFNSGGAISPLLVVFLYKLYKDLCRSCRLIIYFIAVMFTAERGLSC